MKTIPDLRFIESKKIKWIAWFILLAGIGLRLALYLQNRNLLIDEANVVRNLCARNYAELFLPLQYGQYAPPFFLVLEKWISGLLDTYEWSFRLFPLLCSIGSLLFFEKILRSWKLSASRLYPLSLMAFGLIYVRYGSEIKQYAGDTFCSLALLYFSLHFPLNKAFKSILIWSILGVVAIYFSMPSIFILATIVLYWMLQFVKNQQAKKIMLIVPIATFWLVAFGLYYWFNLRHSIGSDYLNNSHQIHLLQWHQSFSENIQHNWDALATFWSALGGHWVINSGLNILLFLVGIVYLLKKDKQKLILLATPLLFVLAAVCIGKFTLMPRVCLFVFPYILAIIGIGFQSILTIKKSIWIKAPLMFCAVYSVLLFQECRYFIKPYQIENPCQAFDWVLQRANRQTIILAHHSIVPALIYYSDIHPNKQRWQQLKPYQKVEAEDKPEQIWPKIKQPILFMALCNNNEEAYLFKKNVPNLGLKLLEQKEAKNLQCYWFVPTNNP